MLLGKLLYKGTTGDDVEFYYITLCAELFSTSVIDLLAGCLGSLPSAYQLLRDIINDALSGIASGIYDAARASDVLANIPEALSEGVSITTVAYLQGGNPQYYTVPQDLYLKDVSMDVVTLGLLTTDIDSLEAYGCRAVRVTYATALEVEDGELPENMLVYDSASGNYTVFRLPASEWNNTASPEDGGIVAQYSYDLQYSACIVHAIGALWGEEPTPYSQGHYLNPYEAISYSPGSISSAGALSLPFLFSSGLQFSVPFTTASPSANTIAGNYWTKLSLSNYVMIKRDILAQPFLRKVGGVTPVGKKPKPEYIRKLKGRLSGGGIVVVGTAIALLWLSGRRKQ